MEEVVEAVEQEALPALKLTPRIFQAPPFASTLKVTHYTRQADGKWFILDLNNKWIRMDGGPVEDDQA